MNLTRTFSLFLFLYYTSAHEFIGLLIEIVSLQPQEHNYKTDSYLAKMLFYGSNQSFGFSMTFQMCKRRLDKSEESDES